MNKKEIEELDTEEIKEEEKAPEPPKDDEPEYEMYHGFKRLKRKK